MPIRKKGDRLNAKKRFDPITGEEINKPKPPRTIYAPKPQVPPERQMRTGGLSPKQKAIASKAPPPNKITGADFAVLKKEKAKGRGMGLQDEKIKPGKVMKANKGKSIDTKAFKKTLGVMPTIDKAFPRLKADPTKPISSVKPNVSNSYMKSIGVFPKVSGPLKKKKLPGRIGTVLGIGSMMVPAAYGVMKQYKDYKSAKNRDKAKVKKYSKGGDLRLDYIDRQTRLNEKATGKKNYIAESKKTRREEYGAAKDRYPNKTDKLRSVAKNVGRALTPSFAAAKSVYDKLSKSSAEKYMGGGMIQRPMGYKSGTMVKARGCKLGRTRPTKIT